MAARTAVDRGREVRQRLLAAAAELIPELGWAGVSTRAVATRAGVAPGLVHYHFSSLQALLRDAAVGVLRRLLDETTPVLARADTPTAGIDLLLGSLDAYDGTDRTSLLFVETYLAAVRDEELHAEIATLLANFRDELARWLGGHDQEMPDETATVLAATVDGVMLHRALDPHLRSDVVAPVLRRLLRPADD